MIPRTGCAERPDYHTNLDKHRGHDSQKWSLIVRLHRACTDIEFNSTATLHYYSSLFHRVCAEGIAGRFYSRIVPSCCQRCTKGLAPFVNAMFSLNINPDSDISTLCFWKLTPLCLFLKSTSSPTTANTPSPPAISKRLRDLNQRSICSTTGIIVVINEPTPSRGCKYVGRVYNTYEKIKRDTRTTVVPRSPAINCRQSLRERIFWNRLADSLSRYSTTDAHSSSGRRILQGPNVSIKKISGGVWIRFFF